MTEATTIEFLDDSSDFVIRNIKMTFSDLWTPDRKYDRFSATLETSDKKGVVAPLVKRIHELFVEAGAKRITQKEIVQNGIAAKSFVRQRAAEATKGEDYNIVLRARNSNPPKVLDSEFRILQEAEGKNQTWLSVVNVIGSCFIVDNEQKYCYGSLKCVQIIQPGKGGGGMSAEDAARALGGTLKKNDIADFRHQGTARQEGPEGDPNANLGPPKDFDDSIPF